MAKQRITGWVTPETHEWLAQECERRGAPASQIVAAIIDDARRHQTGVAQSEVLQRLTAAEELTLSVALESATIYRLVHQLLVKDFGAENARVINERARESAQKAVRQRLTSGGR
ncbi:MULTISPECIES: hypothetical protein [Deinococcus]|uniref:Ribbon-helix-helix protein CopG domain-containing protein n=1 Tax=Deinococcus rufus TaxID=2136097 RepID=A0ABV7Z9Z8_9DEIO|nr:hypothetical protein [Deinococcus sp. AB2017081]WQE97462.1 hypothetical protein U2P90_20110 [Deinococcus sp. AB2017081]WQE97485.1 hypothetical protein U2P90_19980 [Deinococcus sp. AB2017081]